jgi:hypothetical protein
MVNVEKVRFIPKWAMKTQRGSRGVVILFSFRWGWVVNATPRPLYLREGLDTRFIGGWVGPRAGLDECGKSHPARF